MKACFFFFSRAGVVFKGICNEGFVVLCGVGLSSERQSLTLPLPFNSLLNGSKELSICLRSRALPEAQEGRDLVWDSHDLEQSFPSEDQHRASPVCKSLPWRLHLEFPSLLLSFRAGRDTVGLK